MSVNHQVSVSCEQVPYNDLRANFDIASVAMVMTGHGPIKKVLPLSDYVTHFYLRSESPNNNASSCIRHVLSETLELTRVTNRPF